MKKKVDPLKLRKRLGLNQAEFWGRIEVTQSGGSRYENGAQCRGRSASSWAMLRSL